MTESQLPTPKLSPADFCSLRAIEAGEEMIGTGPQASAYLLLEYNGPWERKAFESSQLPEPVKQHLASFLTANRTVKLLLIKSIPGRLRSSISFFTATVQPEAPVLTGFELSSYEELLSLDLGAVLRGEISAGGRRLEDPLFLICTNGRRDPCCAKFGVPVYQEMVKAGGDSVWQSTHVGGHRFAPVITCLPHGLYFSRLDPALVPSWMEAYRKGQIDLDHYRGRASYSPPAQAAELFLRRETGQIHRDALRLQAVQPDGEAQWLVQFQAAADGREYKLRVQQEITETQVAQSCLNDKVAPLIRWHVVHASTPSPSKSPLSEGGSR